MATFRLETTATMKEYNRDKWWIDSGIVRPLEIAAESPKDALEKWREKVQDRDYIEISKNALKDKSAMYTEHKDGTSKQTGYVITGKTDFDKGDYSGYSTQYIDLWVKIQEITIPEFA